MIRSCIDTQSGVTPVTHVRNTQVFLLGTPFGLRLPMSQPHPRKILTTFGVTAAAIGIRMKMKLL